MDNKEIISFLIKRIEEKKNVKNNIINRFYIDNNIKTENIYPTINYRYRDQFGEMNLPINMLGEPLSNIEELDLSLGDKDIVYQQLSDKLYFSEEDVNKKEIKNNINIAKSTSNRDIKEFQLVSNKIIKDTKDYKKALKDIKGEDFEYLITLISQGGNIDNVLNMDYIPYEKIKEDNDKNIELKDLEIFLKRKEINKNLYNLLKNFYSTKNNNRLYDIFNLSDSDTSLYFEKINVTNLKVSDNVKPKTDIIITFFTISKKNPLDIAYKNRVIYDDTINISLKQDKFFGYNHTSIECKEYTPFQIMSEIYKKIKNTTDDNNLASIIAKDCINCLRKKYRNTIAISKVHVNITPNNSSNMKFYGNKDSYNVFSKYTLGEIDKSENFKSSLKFLYGNFKDYRFNANALLHVRNKSKLTNINDILKSLEPISQYNVDLKNHLSKVHIAYSFDLGEIKLFNFEKVQKNYNSEKIKKYIIYDREKPINESLKFNNYLFRTVEDLYYFSERIINKIQIKNRINFKNDGNYKPYNLLYYKILKKQSNQIIKNIYNFNLLETESVYKVVSAKIVPSQK